MSKVASETPTTKDTGLVPSHRISELEFLILNFFIKKGGNMEVLKGGSTAELTNVMKN